MRNSAISTTNLGKRYLLGLGGGERYRALRDVIVNSFKGLFIGNKKQRERRELWALRNVSLDIGIGQTVGIIGRNGAGKTTLLKLISQITEPTEGEIRLRGRVASLLEIGTGFHPELTGRENIFMNAAILGMSRAEIKRKFGAIVEFAEIERFIDTPVKRYSSGMYVRLAFAVASHLEPEVLLIDEVLAVGDTKFQKKCFEKLDGVSKEGRTVIMVSHNLPAIVNLCQRAILLNAGMIEKDGPASEVVQHYLSTGRSMAGELVWGNPLEAPGNDAVRLHAVRILQDESQGPTADVDISKQVFVQVTYWNLRDDAFLYTAVHLRDRMGTLIFSSSNHRSVSLTDDSWYGRAQPRGLFQSSCEIPGNFLNEGLYTVTVIVGKAVAETQIFQDYVLSFQVHDTGEMRKEFYGGWDGLIRPKLSWHTKYIASLNKT